MTWTEILPFVGGPNQTAFIRSHGHTTVICPRQPHAVYVRERTLSLNQLLLLLTTAEKSNTVDRETLKDRKKH